MKKIIITTLISVTISLTYAQYPYTNIQSSNLSADVANGGLLFYNSINTTFPYHYEIPKGNGTYSILSTGFGISCYLGLDSNLLGTCSFYNANVNFKAGIISAIQDSNYLKKYKQVFKVTRSKIAYHLAHYADIGYQIDSSILFWPGNTVDNQNVSANLAPFKDLNSNNMYEPLQGEYPEICGDEAAFLVFNSYYTKDSSGFFIKPTPIEYRLLITTFYGIDTTVNNTSFYHLELINKDTLNRNCMKTKFSFFLDYDLGCYMNDRIGCDSLLQTSYVYNDDIQVETQNCNNSNLSSLPYLGKRVCSGLKLLNKRLHSFSDWWYGDLGLGGPPESIMQFRSIQETKSSTPFYINPVNGGYTSFLYNGNPNDSTSWSSVYTNNGTASPAQDVRTFSTIDMDTLSPNVVKSIDFALVTSFVNPSPTIRFPEISKFKTDVQYIQSFYDNNLVYCKNVYNNVENSLNNNIRIIPNPSNGLYTITNLENADNVRVYNINGSIIMDIENFKNMNLDLTKQPAGVYYVTIKDKLSSYRATILKQ